MMRARYRVANATGVALSGSLALGTAAMPPIALTDEQLTAIMRACAPLRPDARGAFLEAVAAALQGREIGDGSVGRAIAAAQRQFFDPPLSTDEGEPPHRRMAPAR
jgi:hypothetical protein